MATVIPMKHPKTGIIKKGLYGFSWTSLFFGGIPAILRGDVVIGTAIMVAAILTGGIAGLIWAFIYNKRYTLALLEQGYELTGTPEENAMARNKLGVAAPEDAAPEAPVAASAPANVVE